MKMRMVSIVVVLCVSVGSVHAREARVFTVVKSRQNPVEIDSEKGHFDVKFVMGWVSRRDSVFARIFSNATKLAAEAAATGTYFDGDQLKNSWIIENTDIGHHLDRPWGVANKPLLSGIPADTVLASFTLRMAAYKEDRFKQLIETFTKNEPATGIAVEPYLTYAKVADGIFGSLFGTDKCSAPL
jgi:hypothetical protein